MPPVPLQIAIHRNFADELARELTIPHRLTAFKDETDAEMAALLATTDVLVSGAYRPAWRPADPTRLRLVHSTGAGTDGIAFGALPAGCVVCNVYGHERGVAEQAFLLMLALQRGLLALDANLRRGDWTPQRPYLPEMRDRSLLILGYGHIGQELVRWGQFLGMTVRVLTRTPDRVRQAAPAGVAVGPLAELRARLLEADFVVVAIPAAAGTLDLIGAPEFALMKSTAFLINVGRGPVVNEQDLYTALKTRRIAGAGLDVWYQYPTPGQTRMPATCAFQELDNVIMTPHKPTFETMAYRWKEIAANIGRIVRGEPPLRVVSAS
jgi:phosphoglycerate dehydrogenase-like enzyme